jgi:hypothetical protein
MGKARARVFINGNEAFGDGVPTALEGNWDSHRDVTVAIPDR